MNLFDVMEGRGRREWYVALDDDTPTILSGPHPSRRACRRVVWEHARAAGDSQPWPEVETFPGYPGFSAMRTGSRVYYAARASALHDQGDRWGAAIRAYRREGER